MARAASKFRSTHPGFAREAGPEATRFRMRGSFKTTVKATSIGPHMKSIARALPEIRVHGRTQTGSGARMVFEVKVDEPSPRPSLIIFSRDSFMNLTA
jgi:hypothetical protein